MKIRKDTVTPKPINHTVAVGDLVSAIARAGESESRIDKFSAVARINCAYHAPLTITDPRDNRLCEALLSQRFDHGGEQEANQEQRHGRTQ